ncbi:MAG: adenosine deaminase [Gemmatimonadales bacterium]|nr:adenosine deaminase [Gemmatimonadales bacterium]MYG48084.1 adenosine deaminase [Gemmatimonadales bacterium]MYK03053.1 adenosine deaminase [Candidatus Palauibacter ramosifaciens]
MPNLNEVIRNTPKAELHIHVEGSLEPEMMFDLARRNGVSLPYGDVDEVRRAYSFRNLQEFLDLYYEGMSVLRTEDDFFALADAYLRRAAADNVVHVEMFFDPQAHTARGVSLRALMDGLERASDCSRERGVSVSLILCFLRHLTETEAFETLEAAEPCRDRLLGVGLDSSEVGHPPSKFARVFEAARDMGLRLVAHAGEEGPPEYVWEALDILGVERIDHGNRALEDDALVARLREDRIPLTVCPLSNLELRVVDDLAAHPIKRMLDLGLLATVNSDDPAYFGGYINENFRRVAEAVDLSTDDIQTLARNSFTASFAA